MTSEGGSAMGSKVVAASTAVIRDDLKGFCICVDNKTTEPNAAEVVQITRLHVYLQQSKEKVYIDRYSSDNFK